MKYEVQQRIWSEGSGSKLNPVQTDTKRKGGDEKGNPKGKVKKVKKVGARVYPRVGLRATRRTWYALIARRRGTLPVSAGLLKKKEGQKTPSAKLVNRLQKPSRKSGAKGKGQGKGKTVAEVSTSESEGVDLTGNQEWTEPEAESCAITMKQTVASTLF